MRGFGQARAGNIPEKWWSLNQVIRDEKIAILAVQESHLTSERTDALNDTFAGTMRTFASEDETNPTGARGVAFALNRRLIDTEGARMEAVVPGRAALLTVPWTRGKTLRILNVYAPNDATSNANFWKVLSELLTGGRFPKPDIVLGDTNVVEQSIDRIPPRRDPDEPVEALRVFIQQANAVDGWREREPTKRQFTYLQSSTGSQSRIDRIYVNRNLMAQANDWDVRGPGIHTDHRLVTVAIANNQAPYQGKGRWAIPTSLLADKVFIEGTLKLGQKLQSDLAVTQIRTSTENPQVAYLRFKTALCTMARERAKQSVPKLDRQIKALKEDIERKLNQRARMRDEAGVKNDVAIMQARLVELELRRFGRKRLVVTANDWAQGETICRYWTRLNATPNPSSVIQELIVRDGEERTHLKRSDDMSRAAKEHYDGLQKDPTVDREAQATTMTEVLEFVRRPLKDEEATQMRELISDREVECAIMESANGKAPGMDGIPTELWKMLLQKHRAAVAKKKPSFNVAKALRQVYNDIEEHGVLADSGFADGWICPIYKLKKDVREIVNYRPITLLNTDYKIMTRILAMRIAEVAQDIIHPDQAGFVPGRQIFDHIRLNEMIVKYAEAEEVNGMIIALDQEKAYDKIDHAYLWRVLEKFNFPQGFIQTIRNLYGAARSLVFVNGVPSEWFAIVRGVRQGDPVSCLLFDLAIEPLAGMLRESSLKGIDIPGEAERLIAKLFADDTTTYLGENDDCGTLYGVLRKWCSASRAKFNEDKTEFVPIGTPQYRQAVVNGTSTAKVATTLPTGARLIHDGVAIRVLGAWIGNQVDDTLPWAPIVETIRSRLETWGKRKPTMYGRKLAIGMEVGGRSQFLAKAQTMPEDVEERLDQMIMSFVWKGEKKPRIAKERLHRPLADGGLNLLDVKARNEAIDLVWLREYLKTGPLRPTWAYLADALLAKAAMASYKHVEDTAKINVFLQQWRVSTRLAAGLPSCLRRMILTANKYGVRADTPNPVRTLKAQMPIWYHFGTTEGRSVANTKSARCLREKHGVQRVSHAVTVAARLTRRPSTMGQHRQHQNCKCEDCERDRLDNDCDNPHRCAVAASKMVHNLHPIWDPENQGRWDGLSLTRRRKDQNDLAREAKGRVTFDPSLSSGEHLDDVFRVFVRKECGERVLPARRPPGLFQLQAEEVEVYTDGSCDANGTQNARAGSGAWFGTNDERNIAVRVPGGKQSNQTAEIFAMAAVAVRVPPFAPLHIVSDSKYIVDGLTTHLARWEMRGWLGVANAEHLQDLVARLRARSAPTTLRWVKGHSGVTGNDAADALAKAGAAKDRAVELPKAKTQYLRRGASVSAITQKIAYMGIRDWETGKKKERPATDRSIDRIQTSLMAALGTAPPASAIWQSIRHKDVPRRVRDFWWKATHDALRVGKYWRNIPGYEDRATCYLCGCTESLEHILLECEAPGQRCVWDEVESLLTKANAPAFPKTYGVVLGAPALSFREQEGPNLRLKERLTKILMVEATHLIWKLRCERVIQWQNDPEMWLHENAIRNRWKAAINRRLRIDQGLTARRLEKRAIPRDTVLGTWEGVIHDADNLPEDWIGRPGVLVGNSDGPGTTGVG